MASVSSANEDFVRAAGLGVISGLRSMTGPALVSYRAAQRPGDLAETPLRLLASERGRLLLTLGAAGELVIDKLPVVPARTKPGPLAGRILFGALAGAGVALEDRQSALAGAYLGAAFRETAKQRLHIPYAVSGLVEDAVTILAGRRIAGV